MSKFKDVESLVDEIYLWLSKQFEYMELKFDEVVNGKKTVDQKILELEKLYTKGVLLENFLDNILDSSSTSHSEALKLLDHLIHKLHVRISEYKDLPVVPLSVTPVEDSKEKNEEPPFREATAMELAFVKEVNKLQEEVDVLVAYKAGTPALKKAQDRAVLLKRLSPALEEDTPSELPPIYDILSSTCTKIENAIREQSTRYGSLR